MEEREFKNIGTCRLLSNTDKECRHAHVRHALRKSCVMVVVFFSWNPALSPRQAQPNSPEGRSPLLLTFFPSFQFYFFLLLFLLSSFVAVLLLYHITIGCILPSSVNPSLCFPLPSFVSFPSFPSFLRFLPSFPSNGPESRPNKPVEHRTNDWSRRLRAGC